MLSLREYVDRYIKDQAVLQESNMATILRSFTELRQQIEELREDTKKAVTEIDYTRRHEALEERISRVEESLSLRIAAIERWQANITGRTVAIGVLGGIMIAVVAALITHLINV